MGMKNYQKFRLNEFNDFDIERLMKDNVEVLSEESENAISLITDENQVLPDDVVREFSELVENYSSESIYVLSVLHHTEDIYAFYTNGPLFRKESER